MCVKCMYCIKVEYGEEIIDELDEVRNWEMEFLYTVIQTLLGVNHDVRRSRPCEGDIAVVEHQGYK